MSLYVIFWDGVGYGDEDSSTNPFFAGSFPVFRSLLDGRMFSLGNRRISSRRASVTPVNTTLGIPGLPQSGTGQAAIFTGINAPKLIGKHYGPHPYSTLVPLIKEKNIFRQIEQVGKTFFFANAYPQRYFDFINSPRGKVPVVALSYLSARRRLNTVDQISSGKAISADLTNEGLNRFGYSLPVLTLHEAGEKFYRLGKAFDFVLFEYFFPDEAGHSKRMEKAVPALERIDGFLHGILEVFNYEKDVLLFISDHGNVEDLSTKSHTRNPVPLIAIGEHRKYFSERIRRLTDVTPAVVSFLSQ